MEQDEVRSSNWSPPVLKGVVQAGEVSFRAGLVIKGPIDIENICGCRSSREWGTICAHSVAVGLHHLKEFSGAGTLSGKPSAATGLTGRFPVPQTPASQLRRGAEAGEAAELFVILPPVFEHAAGRGKVMVCFEAKWRGGRVPLNALPRSEAFLFS